MKNVFTKDKRTYIGFFASELIDQNLPFVFKIKNQTGTFTVTKELRDRYPASLVNFRNDSGINGSLRHEIPTSEFEYYLNPYEPFKGPPIDLEDAFMDRWSLRDLFSIYNNVPVSNKQWLNELIKNNKK